MPTNALGSLSSKHLANLSAWVSWRLEYERKAASLTLFDYIPPFESEAELINLMRWQSSEMIPFATSLMYAVSEIQKEIQQVVIDARESGNAKDFLEYAQQLQGELAAAASLLERINHG